MESNSNIPKWVIREAVTDCKDVNEFAHKYRKPDRFTGRGEEHEKALMQNHIDDIAKRGYTTISHHDNVTGSIVAYIPQTN
jgi:hypothetical protein